ncbi:MAG: radical SAM protein, partial [Bacteroidales bacterium]|nr:radical SAM protein [Bacteroidales bacterium]
QVFFVPWYACNFACSYCYQDEYSNEKSALNTEIIDTFFSSLNQLLGNKRKYITLFGGEPLLSGNLHKNLVTYFLQKAEENKLQVAIVTNGYNLKEYIPLLNNKVIREIQVTLDGTAETHNQRRYLKDHSPTFNKISEGVDLLLENEIPVNLRMVVDKENLQNLPDFAEYAIKKAGLNHHISKRSSGEITNCTIVRISVNGYIHA